MAISICEKQLNRQNCNSMSEVEHIIRQAAAEATGDKPLELEIALDHGKYQLEKPLVLSATELPGLANVKLTLKAVPGMHPVVTDLVRIPTADMKQVEGKPYMTYQFPKGEDGKYPQFHDFYIDGKKLTMAKSRVYINPFSWGAERGKPLAKDDPMGFYVPMDLAKELCKNPLDGAELHMYVEWEWDALRVESVDMKNTKQHDGETYVLVKVGADEYETFKRHINGCLDIDGRETFFLNSLSFLTEPGSFVYDYKNGTLYVIPDGPLWWNIAFEYPVLENLITMEGLRDVTVEGITFRGVGSKYICENGYCSGQANNESRAHGQLPHAALITRNMRNFTLRGCSFSGIGANGIQMRDNNTRVQIYDCVFENIAMSALSIGNPAFDWNKWENKNFAISIINNRFEHIAYEYPTAVCIYIGLVDGLKIMHNTIKETAYSAISAGWGWSMISEELGERVNIRDAEIAYNHFVDYMQLLRDGAAIYVVGANCSVNNGTRFNSMHDNFAERELFCDGSKRGYYMDGASSNWEVYDNVTTGCRLPIFSQFHVPQQFTHHNYIHDIYTTDPIDKGNHAPDRDTILGECFFVPEGLEALFAAYPKAKEIADASGCDLD